MARKLPDDWIDYAAGRAALLPDYEKNLVRAIAESQKPREQQQLVVYDIAHELAQKTGRVHEFCSALNMDCTALRALHRCLRGESKTFTLPYIWQPKLPKEPKPPRLKENKPHRRTREEYLTSVRKPKPPSRAVISATEQLAVQKLLAEGKHHEIHKAIAAIRGYTVSPKTIQRVVQRVLKRHLDLHPRSAHRPPKFTAEIAEFTKRYRENNPSADMQTVVDEIAKKFGEQSRMHPRYLAEKLRSLSPLTGS